MGLNSVPPACATAPSPTKNHSWQAKYLHFFSAAFLGYTDLYRLEESLLYDSVLLEPPTVCRVHIVLASCQFFVLFLGDKEGKKCPIILDLHLCKGAIC